MYLPKVFLETDRSRLHALMEANAFAMLLVPGAPDASAPAPVEIAHLPFVLDRGEGEHGRLRVHVARANPIWKRALDAGAATVVFTGAHGYVSPRWYASPTRQVPTWNYEVVHAHGRIEGPMDRAALAALLGDLAAIHERGAPSPWAFFELDLAVREELLDQIVGLTIAIERLEGKFKLSQNRSPEDRQRVIAALRERGQAGDLELVRAMTEQSEG